jgi:wyosine [tRNA(Phe)-imidazoG37] synthetase (radical SAM superfamily)
MERAEYVPLEEVISDIEQKLAEKCAIDYITLSGSGEPTLFNRLGELIDAIKTRTDIPVAIITNGSMLWDENVRKELLKVDLAVPSIDAGNAELFKTVNRPCEGLEYSKIIDGIKQFAREFKGKIWLEVFLLDKISDSFQAVKEIAKLAKSINPDLTQINTVARPTCEDFARPVSKQRLAELKNLFKVPTEIIADFSKEEKIVSNAANEDDIINLLSRRPCSCKDISDSLCLHYNEVLKIIEQLLRKKVIVAEEIDNKVFYKCI